MSKPNLVVVESPSKVKTIEKILGKDFKVTSCYGHIRDLSKEKMGVDLKNNYAPNYIIPEDKKKVVSELKKLSKEAEGNVWLATDEDREGESISWHLCEVLKLDPKTTKRIVFHEITKPAIESAIKKPRLLNLDLVNAQQARRVVDRLVGFKLSPVLIRKVPSAGSLSAGRVQSVAVRLIVEREKEIKKFNEAIYFKPIATLRTNDAQFSATAPQYSNVDDVETFFEACKKATFSVSNVDKKEGYRKPAPPFTTSTLQQEAVKKLGYSVSKTMLIAQRLYEEGYITYMRTDSVNLSKVATDGIADYVEKQYGKNYHTFRQYVTQNRSAQEAHEAIRPTDMFLESVPDSNNQRLYDLIRKRTIASQMANAQLERTSVDITISTRPEKLKAQGEVILFDGFLKVYQEGREDDEVSTEDDDQFLPELKVGQKVDLISFISKEKRTKPVGRYNEASLVKQMDALGIGRPSTYAPTIATILKRGYVEKKTTEGEERMIRVIRMEKGEIKKQEEKERFGAEKNKLFPSDLGMLVNEFLEANFEEIMDYKFTAKLEEDFDKIATGEHEWTKVVADFFTPFEDKVKVAEKTGERISGERELGIDPQTTKMVRVRMGRYGPMVQLGETDSEEKPKFAKLLPGQQISTITMQEAMELLSLPKHIGDYKGLAMVIKQGPFGPYVAYNSKFYSIPKGENIFKLDATKAIQLIEEKNERDANSMILNFPEEKIQVLNGRFGVYIKAEEGNFKIPKKDQEKAKDFSIEDIKAIIKEQQENPQKGKRKWGKK